VSIRRREKDSRRVAKSIRTHQETMDAYGAAAAGSGQDVWKRFLKPESVRLTTSPGSKVEKQRTRGLLTDKEASEEQVHIGIKAYSDEGKETFHKGLLKPAAQYQKEKDK
jgi:hypothetical protein